MKSPAKKRTTGVPPARLRASEYGRNAVDMAKFLLGTILCRRLDDGTVLRARIVETEAYFGEEDTACHAHRGRTPRTDVMYAPGGFAYVYLCYGMHAMLNVVTGPVGHPEAVLVRGVEGAVGPGRLTKALRVTCALNRENLVESERLWIESDGAPPRFDASPRIGIGYASKRDRERKWRFSVRSSAAPSGILRFATLRTMPENPPSPCGASTMYANSYCRFGFAYYYKNKTVSSKRINGTGAVLEGEEEAEDLGAVPGGELAVLLAEVLAEGNLKGGGTAFVREASRGWFLERRPAARPRLVQPVSGSAASDGQSNQTP